MHPLVSVVIPNYNHAHYLPRAIDSILHQEHRDLELILIEDGSTDHSLEIIQSYCAKDQRVRLIEHKKNQGIYISMKDGLEAARGKYIHFLGADDFHFPHFLSSHIHTFHHFPEAVISLCDSCFYHDCPKAMQYYPLIRQAKEPTFIPADKVAHMLQTTWLKFSGTNTLIQTALVRKIGGFDAKFQASCDWFTLTKIALTYGSNYIPKPLCCWKKNPSGVAATTLDIKWKRQEMYREVLADLSKQTPELFKKFKISGELGCVMKYAPLELVKRPQYWSFLPPIIKRFLLRKWHRLFFSNQTLH